MTIAALATPPISGALGIIRVSGPDAISCVETLFVPHSGGTLSAQPSHKAVYGQVMLEGRVLDQGLCLMMRAPHSSTGEDVAELHLHGSMVVLNAALSALWKAGARAAEPGEFTRRAFLNGKLELSQAEAVRDLIAAQTLDAAFNAAGQLSGVIERRYMRLYDALAALLAHFQAVADYPEEDIALTDAAGMQAELSGIIAELNALLNAYNQQGRVLTEGVRCAIVGKPNVGKSSLLNALIGYDRAIVSEAPGTTRDTLEEHLRLGGVLLRLTDCAGLRHTQDPLEQQGVDRTRAAAEQAGLLFVVLDASRPLDDDDRHVLDLARERPSVILLNKSDLPGCMEKEMLEAAFLHICHVSALTGEGLDYLDSVVRRLFDTRAVCDGSILTGARQAEAVRATLDAATEARNALEQGYTPDAAMGELERAMNALSQLTGRAMSEDVLDRIFSDFCVGK